MAKGVGIMMARWQFSLNETNDGWNWSITLVSAQIAELVAEGNAETAQAAFTEAQAARDANDVD